jgi:asparagine synthase (glutamine-hydrolysing)
MPGIAGMISQRPAAECRDIVDSMIASMKFEPFYRTGTHHVPEAGIYAGWTALDDSPNAHQCFCNEEKNITLLFSGECYADPSIKAELRAKHHQFETGQADWLVHSYEEEGMNFFKKLNGLFSGLLIDMRAGQAFLFNDRYGIERIYFHESKDAVYFASEAKALLAVVPELRRFDPEGAAQFLVYGCTLSWKTLFAGVALMPGGSLWTFESGRCKKERYFSPAAWEAQSELSPEAFESAFQETFRRILPRYFESDSRVGISLTAGLDTRMIMACLPEHIEKPVCYTYAEAGNETLDTRLAAAVAETCELEHRVLRLESGFFENFASHADRTVYITDGCYGILGSHEVFLSQRARQYSTIRMTGNYGGEILRGVSGFKSTGLSASLLNPDLQKLADAGRETAVRGEKNPVGVAVFKEIPWGLFGNFCASRSQVVSRTPYLDNELVALAFRVPEALRASSRTALGLVSSQNKALAAIPTDQGLLAAGGGPGYAARVMFEKIASKLDYHFSADLPDVLARLDPLLNLFNGRGRLFGRHKFLHYRSWFRKELAEYLQSTLADAASRQQPFWDPDVLKTLAEDHIRGRKNNIGEIHAVLTLDAVDRLLLRQGRRK